MTTYTHSFITSVSILLFGELKTLLVNQLLKFKISNDDFIKTYLILIVLKLYQIVKSKMANNFLQKNTFNKRLCLMFLLKFLQLDYKIY